MSAVLAIDAAWTESRPSGVALVRDTVEGWRCVAAAPSYGAFLGLADGIEVDWNVAPQGAMPDPTALLAASNSMLGDQEVDVVTADMPISTVPITGRRAADRAVSRAFGRVWCSTHSPGLERPGRIGKRLTEEFENAGYGLAAVEAGRHSTRHLVEVYPCPALLKLLQLQRRLPYKVDKSRKYWPNSDRRERITRLLAQFHEILSGLEERIQDIPLKLPDPDQVTSLSALKRYEDILDALVCAWVGIKYVAGRTEPYGDRDAAIWIPSR